MSFAAPVGEINQGFTAEITTANGWNNRTGHVVEVLGTITPALAMSDVSYGLGLSGASAFRFRANADQTNFTLRHQVLTESILIAR